MLSAIIVEWVVLLLAYLARSEEEEEEAAVAAVMKVTGAGMMVMARAPAISIATLGITVVICSCAKRISSIESAIGDARMAGVKPQVECLTQPANAGGTDPVAQSPLSSLAQPALIPQTLLAK